jgi:hypothetical protein
VRAELSLLKLCRAQPAIMRCEAPNNLELGRVDADALSVFKNDNKQNK